MRRFQQALRQHGASRGVPGCALPRVGAGVSSALPVQLPGHQAERQPGFAMFRDARQVTNRSVTCENNSEVGFCPTLRVLAAAT